MNEWTQSWRALMRSPGFTLTATLTLAIGIGVNTSMFSLVSAALLKPTIFRDAHQLTASHELSPSGSNMGISWPSFKDWRAQQKSFSEFGGVISTTAILSGIDKPTFLSGRLVSANFFDIVGVKPALGRAFTVDEDRAGGPPVVILHHRTWQNYFGSDPNVIGKSVTIDSVPHTVIGVLPRTFTFWFNNEEYFRPLGTLDADRPAMGRGNHGGLIAIARRKPGVSIESAQAEMTTIAANLEREYPQSNSGVRAKVNDFEEWTVGPLRPTLIAFGVAVCIVLLIACVNVANMLLARASARRRDVVIRSALGASRWRIVRSLLGESVVLAVIAGVGGVLLAFWSLDALKSVLPNQFSRVRAAQVEPMLILVSFFCSTLVSVLFGLLPAWQASRTDAGEALRAGGGRGSTMRHQPMRRLLLISEVALAVMLSVGAALLLRSMQNVVKTDLGFSTERLLTARIALDRKQYPGDSKQIAFYRTALEKLRGVPGVQAASMSSSLAVVDRYWGSIFTFEGKVYPKRSDLPGSQWNTVGTDYFRTLGLPLKLGRLFTEEDHRANRNLAIVNEEFVRLHLKGENPIGKRIKQGWPEDSTPMREIVGVVGSIKQNGPERNASPEVYLMHENETWASMFVSVRTAIDPEPLTSTLREVIRGIDKDVPVYDMMTMDARLSDTLAARRFVLWLISAFAALAMGLAAIGLFGVIAYSVTQRTQEIGVRMALGADRIDVARMVVREGVLLALIGIAAGLAGAAALKTWLATLLFGVQPIDAPSFLFAAVAMLLVGMLASYLPARRAAALDPQIALRYE